LARSEGVGDPDAIDAAEAKASELNVKDYHAGR